MALGWGAPDASCSAPPNTFRSTKYDNMPDMVDAAFPALLKVQGLKADGRFGGGSGFVISEDGLVVTNVHVFQSFAMSGSSDIVATFDDGRSYRIELVAADEDSDIVVGRLVAPPGTKFRTLPIADSSSRMRRGDFLCVLGAPLGGSLVPTAGVLSGQRYVADDAQMATALPGRGDWCLLQVDASMSSGNSGGPIVNADGEVVGISVMVQTAGDVGVGTVNYGVSIDQAGPIIRALVSEGIVNRPVVGMGVETVDGLSYERHTASAGITLLPTEGTPKMQRGADGHYSRVGSLTLAEATYPAALLVGLVAPGLPAASAGLQEGDVILEANGRRTVRIGDYYSAVGAVYEPNHQVKLLVYRPRYPNNNGHRDQLAGCIFEVLVHPAQKASRPVRPLRSRKPHRRWDW